MSEFANNIKRTPADSRELTKRYGKVIDGLTWVIEGRKYFAELRNQLVQGSYRFACICQIRERPSEYMDIPVLVAVGAEADDVVRKVRAELERHVLVTWSPYIYINVVDRGVRGYDECEGFTIGHEIVLVGVRPDGSRCYRRRARLLDEKDYQVVHQKRQSGEWHSDAEIVNDLPRVGEPTRGYDGDGHRGLIPWSEDAEARIRTVIAALKDLHDRVSSMLGNPDPAVVLGALQGPSLVRLPTISKEES